MIHHDASILVADGARFLLLRNTGDMDAPTLVCEASGEQDNPATREQGSDAPGRAFATAGSGRSAMEQTDFHRLQKDRFAEQVAGIVGDLLEAGDLHELIVVAPPATLGQLRDSFAPAVAAKVVKEIAKDLTGHPVNEISRVLAE